jgi:hypothetical protein
MNKTLAMIHEVNEVPKFSEQEINLRYLTNLFTSLCVFFIKVGGDITKETGNEIVNLFNRVGANNEGILGPIMLSYSGLCQGMGNKVNCQDFEPTLLKALSITTGTPATARLACEVVSELSFCCNEDKIKLNIEKLL